MSEYFIKNIEIDNFKCFNNFKADGFERVNLIGGKNNVGKTAFMEACYLGLSTSSDKTFFHSLLVIELSRNPLEEFNIVEDSNSFKFKFNESKIFINDKQRKIDNSPFSDTLYEIPHRNYGKGIKEIEEFYSLKNRPLKIKNKNFVSINSVRDDYLSECLGDMKLNRTFDEFSSLLNKLFGIKKLDEIKHQMMIETDEKHILLNEFGDGVKHFINIILALYLNKKSTIFLDEIDNGIHYLLFDEMWKIILEVSKEQDVQVFATTHSKECIESFSRVSKELDDKDIAYIKMTRNDNESIMAGVRNYDMLQESMEESHEVRGW